MEYGCIGKPLVHSFSAEIHGMLADYSYTLCEISERELPQFFEKRDFLGINVTVPYKEAVLPYLDNTDTAAAKIGAVNTVVNRNGVLFGYNTDIIGMQALFCENGVELKNKKVLILGSGGTSKTARVLCENNKAKEIITVSRSKNKGTVTYEQANNNETDADIIINTTPCGMYPDFAENPIDISRFSSLSFVMDAVYNPLKTKLVCDARNLGIKASGGLYMLVAQAAAAYTYFCSEKKETSVCREIFRKIQYEKQNIVLIGMPGCGKTTVGKLLADKLSRPFYDTDAEFERINGITPAEYIKKYGENRFRAAESDTVKTLRAVQGAVISTGGGTVTVKENTDILRQNGKLVFIDRPLDLLFDSNDRPLSDTKEKLRRLYEVRYPIYKAAADVTVIADGTAEEAARQTKEVTV